MTTEKDQLAFETTAEILATDMIVGVSRFDGVWPFLKDPDFKVAVEELLYKYLDAE